MLSLSPRLDLFDFKLPKMFFPNEILEKYTNMIQRSNPSVMTSSLDYINESIIGVTFPGFSDLVVSQPQVSFNPGQISQDRIIIEPSHENRTLSSENILAKIDSTFTITFRMNQGLINYFMLYETAFYRYCRPWLYMNDDLFQLYLKNEDGTYISKVLFYQPEITSIDGLEFSYNKLERGAETFSVAFSFNNIDFDFL